VSRISVRNGVAELLASLVDDSGGPMFRAVYSVMPTRIDKTLTPAAFVMLPKHNRRRYGPNQKHADYIGQARVMYAAPSVGWESPAAGQTLWETPAGEPQAAFDEWLDTFARALEQNKHFPQNQPEAGVQTIQIGEGGDGIDIVTSEPELEANLLVLSALVSFPIAEQILGV